MAFSWDPRTRTMASLALIAVVANLHCCAVLVTGAAFFPTNTRTSTATATTHATTRNAKFAARKSKSNPLLHSHSESHHRRPQNAYKRRHGLLMVPAERDGSTTATTDTINGNSNSNSNSSNDKNNEEDPWFSKVDTSSSRAGKDGFSLNRQPVSWDAESDPTFAVPLSLDEDAAMATKVDDQWWNSERNKNMNKNIMQQKHEGYKFEDQSQNTRTLREQAAETLAAAGDENPYDLAASLSIDVLGRSPEALDFPLVLKALSEACDTAPARRIVREAAGGDHSVPRPSKKEIKKSALATISFQPLLSMTVEGSQTRYHAVQELKWILQAGDGKDVQLKEADCSYRNIRGRKESVLGRPPPNGGLSFNLDETVTAAADEGRVLEGEDIQEILAMLETMQNVQLWGSALSKIDDLEFKELPHLVSAIQVNDTLKELLDKAFDKKTGMLSGVTFQTIGTLRAKIRSFKMDIMRALEGILALPSVSDKLATESGGSLISEVSGGRLVIPIDSKHASKVGIVHESSRSGKTSYVEPSEIIGSTNELRQAEMELRNEEARIWRSLTSSILENRKSLEQSAYAIGQLDLVHARYRLGETWSGVVPTVADEGVIALKNARHPVLLLRKIPNVVGSDVEFGVGENRGLVLTGPNSGGKTVILKLIGLVALLSRSGIPVPASGPSGSDGNVDLSAESDDYQPRVDLFNPVLADIGNDIQSVGDLSTFQGHMLVCREMLKQCGRNSLVLMDEVGSGTDPAQGVAIAQSLLESMIDSGARIAITTHFMQLKTLAASDPRFSVAGMQFIRGRPTYKLLPGTVGESFALAVAERMRLPMGVIERANELLDSETRQMGDLLRELEDQKLVIEEKAFELEERRKEMARREFEVEGQLAKLESKQLTARRNEARKFAEKLEEKERVLEDVLEKLKQDPSRRVVAKGWEEIKFVKRDAINDAENVASVIAKKHKANEKQEELRAELVPITEMREKPKLQPGDNIVVCKKGAMFGKEGQISRVMGGRIELKLNNMSVSFKKSELAIPPKAYVPPPPTPQASTGGNSNGPGRSISKAVERALADERANGGSAVSKVELETKKPAGPVIRTQSNTVNVLGYTFLEAESRIKDKFSSTLMDGRSNVVYILHGYGTTGALQSKVRNWLRTERTMVKSFKPADESDGGGSFTRVELR